MKKKTFLCFLLSLCLVAGSFSSIAADVSADSSTETVTEATTETEAATEAATEAEETEDSSSVEESTTEEIKDETAESADATNDAEETAEAEDVDETIQDDQLLKVTYEEDKVVIDWKDWTEKYGLKEEGKTYVYNVVVTDPAELTTNENGEEEAAIVAQVSANDQTSCDLALDQLTAGKAYKVTVYYTEATEEEVKAAAEDETLLVKTYDKKDIAADSDLSTVAEQGDTEETGDSEEAGDQEEENPYADLQPTVTSSKTTYSLPIKLSIDTDGYTPASTDGTDGTETTADVRYFVYRAQKTISASSFGDYKLLTTITADKSAKTYSDSSAKAGKSYKYKVILAVATSDTAYDANKCSKTSAIFKVNTPAASKSMVGSPSKRAIILKWSKVTGADGYQIQGKHTSKSGWTGATTHNLTTTTYTWSGLGWYKYTFRVRAYITDSAGHKVFGAWTSDTVNLKNPNTVKIMSYNCRVAYGNARMYQTSSNHKVVARPSRGARVIAYQKSGARYYCKIASSGKTGWINQANLNFTGINKYSKSSYNSDTLLSYINNKNLTSATKYFILVNTYTEQCTVFEGTGKQGQWKKVLYSEKCCTGAYNRRTPMGKRRILKKYKACWKASYHEKYFIAYLITSSGDRNGFHSRLIRNSTGKFWYTGSNADVGKPITGGCIRTEMKELTFMYKHCPKSTGIYIW